MHSSTAFVLTFVALGSFGGSLAAVCPRYATVTNLNIQEQLGNWGIHGLIVSEGAGPDPKLNCLHIDLSGTQFTKEPVPIGVSLAGTYRDNGQAISAKYDASIASLSRPGRWTVNINGTVHDFSILQTDYVQYSLMVQCAVINNVEVTKVLLASRSHDQMPESIVNNYKQALQDEYGMDTSRYYPITHGHACH